MSDGVPEDTNGRSASGMKFVFISQFSNEWSMLVKYKSNVVSKQLQRAFGGSAMRRDDIRN